MCLWSHSSRAQRIQDQKDKVVVIFYMVLLVSLWMSAGVPLGNLGGIYSSNGREEKKESSHCFVHITWKFPAPSRIWRTLYPAPGLIPAVPGERRSVTEQITVYCFLSRLDRPSLTAEAVGRGRERYDGAPLQPVDGVECRLHAYILELPRTRVWAGCLCPSTDEHK